MRIGFPRGAVVKNLSAKQEMQVQFLDWDNPLEEEMATHSSVFTWEITWTEGPGRLQSPGSQRVRHKSATKQQEQQGCDLLLGRQK